MCLAASSDDLFAGTGVALCLIAGLFFACNQPFDPKGELDRRTVLYSVLSTDRTTQYVRVERSYMPEGFDPGSSTTDYFVPNAAITLTGGGIAARFRDASMVRSDTSRNKFPFVVTHAYRDPHSIRLDEPMYSSVN